MIDDRLWLFTAGVLEDMQKQGDILALATDGLMIAPESPLLDTQYRTKDSLISALSLLIDDAFGNISWFVYECDYGRTALEAGCKGDMKMIDSIDMLRWLIELDCEN